MLKEVVSAFLGFLRIGHKILDNIELMVSSKNDKGFSVFDFLAIDQSNLLLRLLDDVPLEYGEKHFTAQYVFP